MTIRSYIISKICDIQIGSQRYNGVTKNIECFRRCINKKTNRNISLWIVFILSGLIYYLPYFVIINILIYLKELSIFNNKDVLSLLIATLWPAIGAPSIWLFEKKILPFYYHNTKTYLNKDGRTQLRYLIFSKITSLKKSKRHFFIIVFWVILCTISFIYIRKYLHLFGIYMEHNIYDKILFFILLVGVIITSYYTSLGMAFIWRSIRAIYITLKTLDSSKINLLDIYDNRLLNSIKKHGFITMILYSSGTMFVPLLYNLGRQYEEYGYNVFLILVVIYIGFLFIMGIFLIYATYTVAEKTYLALSPSILKKIIDCYYKDNDKSCVFCIELFRDLRESRFKNNIISSISYQILIPLITAILTKYIVMIL